MSQRLSDFFLTLIATGVAFLLSLPFWQKSEYWPESQEMWAVYFVVGFLLAAYVFYIFLGCLRTLFLHDTLIKSGYIKPVSSDKEEGDLL